MKHKPLAVGDRVSFILEGWEQHFNWYLGVYERKPDYPKAGQTTFNDIRWLTWIVSEIDDDGFVHFTNGEYSIGRIPKTLANKWLGRRK